MKKLTLAFLECKYMNFQSLKLDYSKQGLVKLIFSNPKNKNAFNPEMIFEIKKALKLLENSNDCKILIFTGEGDIFSSGADLVWMKESKNLNFEQNKKQAKDFTDMLSAIDSFTKPTISLVNGHAFGGALGLIAASDFSISAEKSKFCFSEVKLGLIPAVIAPYILRAIGYKTTKQLFLSGELFAAKKALDIGLIDEIINIKEFDKFKGNLISDLFSGAPQAQSQIKSFLNKIHNKQINKDLINETAEKISKIRVSEEAQEGVEAFLEKRKPKWKNNAS